MGWTAQCFGQIESLENKHFFQWFNQLNKKITGQMTDYTSVFVEYTKTKAVSYRCHHPIQSGKNSIFLSLHIYCEAMQQSGVASTSRHVKVCKAQVACKRHLSPPTLSFCWSGWHVGNNLIELSGQTKMNAFSYMKIKTWMLKPLGLVCLACPLHSINISSLDVNIDVPRGTKTSFFRTKGDYTRWEAGDQEEGEKRRD